MTNGKTEPTMALTLNDVNHLVDKAFKHGYAGGAPYVYKDLTSVKDSLIKYHHRYIVLHGFLMELDTEGRMIGRVAVGPLMDVLENGHKDVYWDNRSRKEYNLQVGDQWIPPEGYFD